MLKHTAVNHLFLPHNGDCARAELFEKQMIFGIKVDVFKLRVVPELVDVLGIDHIGFWHPGRLQQPSLQPLEIDAFKKHMASWVISPGVGKIQ